MTVGIKKAVPVTPKKPTKPKRFEVGYKFKVEATIVNIERAQYEEDQDLFFVQIPIGTSENDVYDVELWKDELEEFENSFTVKGKKFF